MLTFDQIKEITQHNWYRMHIDNYKKNKCSHCKEKYHVKLYCYTFDYHGFSGVTSSCERCVIKFEDIYMKTDGSYKLCELNEKELFTISILC